MRGNDPRARELNGWLGAFGPRAFGCVRAMIARRRLEDSDLGMEAKLPVNKVTWQQVGHVTEPGRYMFRFGWLMIVPDDLAIWEKFPDASFTLVQTLAPPLAAESDTDGAPTVEMDEYHLGAFEVRLPDQRHGDSIADAAPGSEEATEAPSSMELQSSV